MRQPQDLTNLQCPSSQTGFSICTFSLTITGDFCISHGCCKAASRCQHKWHTISQSVRLGLLSILAFILRRAHSSFAKTLQQACILSQGCHKTAAKQTTTTQIRTVATLQSCGSCVTSFSYKKQIHSDHPTQVVEILVRQISMKVFILYFIMPEKHMNQRGRGRPPADAAVKEPVKPQELQEQSQRNDP